MCKQHHYEGIHMSNSTSVGGVSEAAMANAYVRDAIEKGCITDEQRDNGKEVCDAGGRVISKVSASGAVQGSGEASLATPTNVQSQIDGSGFTRRA